MRRIQVGTGPVAALQFTPDGTALLCTEGRGPEHWAGHRAVHRIDPASGTVAHTLDLEEAAWRRSFSYARERCETGKAFVSPDGLWVAVKRYLGDPVYLDLWNGQTGRWRGVPFESRHHFCVDAAAFTPDGEVLISASGTDGGGTQALEPRRLKTGRRLPSIDFPGATARQLAFTADERRLAVLTYLGVYLIDHRRGPVDFAEAVELELEDEAGPMRFRPDGGDLALAYGDELLFWDGRSPRAETVRPTDDVVINDLAFAPDGRTLTLACDDGIVRVWDRQAGRPTREYNWRIGPVASSVCFAPDGQTCAAGGTDGQVVLWDVID